MSETSKVLQNDGLHPNPQPEVVAGVGSVGAPCLCGVHTQTLSLSLYLNLYVYHLYASIHLPIPPSRALHPSIHLPLLIYPQHIYPSFSFFLSLSLSIHVCLCSVGS